MITVISIVVFILWLSWFLFNFKRLLKHSKNDVDYTKYPYLANNKLSNFINTIPIDDYSSISKLSDTAHDNPESYSIIEEIIYFIEIHIRNKTLQNVNLYNLPDLGNIRRVKSIEIHRKIITLINFDYIDYYSLNSWRKYLIENKLLLIKPMKNKVYCFSKLEMLTLIKNNHWSRTKSINTRIAIISINNTEEETVDWTTEYLPIMDCTNCDVEEYNYAIKENFLSLRFRDDNEDFSPELAIVIIDFIRKHPWCDILVHCIMGKSRSQAVCRFILDTWPDNYEYAREKENPLRTPNYHVLSTLKRIWRLKFEENETSVQD